MARSYEQTYVTAYAEITNVVVNYQPLRILHHNNSIKNQARNAIAAAGGDPDHPNITYLRVANDSAWMRDNGPVYVVQDGEMRIQDWDFDAWGGAFGNFPCAADDAVPIRVGSALSMPVDTVSIVHERGNLEFNGVDTVMLNWNVIGNPNRGNGYANKAAAEVDLKNWFGVTQVVWADGPIEGDLTGGRLRGDPRGLRQPFQRQCREGAARVVVSRQGRNRHRDARLLDCGWRSSLPYERSARASPAKL